MNLDTQQRDRTSSTSGPWFRLAVFVLVTLVVLGVIWFVLVAVVTIHHSGSLAELISFV